MHQVFGGFLIMIGLAGAAFAGTTTPEIDPTSGAAAVALLAGGLVVLRGRRKK
jgi:MYXO-CTERM domain-containing protein